MDDGTGGEGFAVVTGPVGTAPAITRVRRRARNKEGFLRSGTTPFVTRMIRSAGNGEDASITTSSGSSNADVDVSVDGANAKMRRVRKESS